MENKTVEFTTYVDLLRIFGADLVKAVGSSAHMMLRRGKIPARHWQTLINIAIAQGRPLPFGVFEGAELFYQQHLRNEKSQPSLPLSRSSQP